jgi:hydroxymethylpyrimidine pyrophosphatase-like HAD family hydrolase
LGLEGTNSNGHGGGKEEDINMTETLKILQTDVQSHKDNNERLMKAKEEQEYVNMKLMKILDIIEKKLDKESGSSKLGSHMTP